MTTLSYSATELALRSPIEEWQPHGKQSESTSGWEHLNTLTGKWLPRELVAIGTVLDLTNALKKFLFQFSLMFSRWR